MEVFVAGATGILGRRVVPELIDAGHRVVGLSRSAANDKLLARLGAEPRRGDLFNSAQLITLTGDCETVLHLATAIPAVARPSTDDWRLNDRIRKEGTANLIASALHNTCRVYVQQSVTFLYGNRHGEWVDESAPVARDLPALLHSAVEMENLVREAIAHHHLPAIILRFGSFYAHDSAQTASMFGGIRSRRFPVIGSGNVFWNLVNIDDAADAVVSAVNSAGRSAHIFNVCDNEPVLSGEYLDYVAACLHVSKPGRVPVSAAEAAIGADTVRLLLSSVRCRNGLAKEELDWHPAFPTFREGIPAEIGKWLEKEL